MARPIRDKYDDEIPEVFDKELGVHEEPVKYLASPPYDLLATDMRFMVSRRHEPDKSIILDYKNISSVEHKRLVNLKILSATLILLSLCIAFLFIPQTKPLIDGFFKWLETSLKFHMPFTTAVFMFWAGLAFGVFGVIALAVFVNSFPYRLVVYYVGKGSLNLPLKLTNDTMELLSVMHEGIKKASSLSKEDVEQIIGDKIGALLGARAQMEQQLLDELKAAAAEAKTPEEKAEVKQLFETSVTKLEEHDMAIEQELRGTGITREELYKKYRIKPPKEEFVDAILSDGQLNELLKF